MKRILIASLLCAVLLLTACASQQENPERDAKKIAEISASLRLPTYDTKEEYDAFMAEYGKKLPKSFVTWEELRDLGDFSCLVLLGDDCYSYKVVDETGSNIFIDVDPSPEATAKTTVSMNSITVDNTGLQKVTHEHGKDVVVVRNGFEYLFRSYGNLYSITWYNDGVQIQISNCLVDYPKGRTDTMVGKLLSVDDAVAQAAMNEITKNLSK